MAMLEEVDLADYAVSKVLGTGADYEVRSAVHKGTGKQVALKRPKPQMVGRNLHQNIEARTQRVLQAYREVGHTVPTVVPILGFTRSANHDLYFRESLNQEYTVIVEERAQGVPLVGDPMARATGVPIGIGQNLFTLFPLVQLSHRDAFPVHRQLLQLEEGFYDAGYLLLDLRPQNIFFQPASGKITVIDCGNLVTKEEEEQGRPVGPRRAAQDIHNFCLEMLKFYTTAQEPPTDADGYREPRGLRPVVRFEQELDEMARGFSQLPAVSRDTVLSVLEKVRCRSYSDLGGFREDLLACLEAIDDRNRALPDIEHARRKWREALGWCREEYWQRFLFDADAELAPYGI